MTIGLGAADEPAVESPQRLATVGSTEEVVRETQ